MIKIIKKLIGRKKAQLKKINYLQNIKSPDVKEIVLQFLNEKRKLDIIIYNKNLQKIIRVDIRYYKMLSGKYKTGKKNGKGKEYDYDGDLIFEGEYLNGKRNGIGKEYYRNGKWNRKRILS